MQKVAIIIPTMNRPDFIFRHFEFYELMNSPHPIYVSDSSNEENAQRIRDGIKRFKNLNITYQWVPPGKDCLYQLMPLIKEKYCMQIGDDDLVIPKTVSECADFLEDHPDYATCSGKQINVRFRQEDYNKFRGLLGRATLPMGRSMEDEDMLARVKNFWSDPNFICFAVTRTEIETKIRNVTKHFLLMEPIIEVILWSMLIIYGKAKIIDKLGYIMQISNNRSFSTDLAIDVLLAPSIKEKWGACQNGLSELLRGLGVSNEESRNVSKWIFILYLANKFTYETSWRSYGFPKNAPAKQESSKKLRYFVAHLPLLKKMYYKFKPPQDATRPESKYFRDFKVVKDFLEKSL